MLGGVGARMGFNLCIWTFICSIIQTALIQNFIGTEVWDKSSSQDDFQRASVKNRSSQGCTETLLGNPKLSRAANNVGQWQGLMRMWLKLWCFATRHSLVLLWDETGAESIPRWWMFGEDLASAYVLCHQMPTVLKFWERVRRFGRWVQGTINVNFRLGNIHEVWNIFISGEGISG